MPMFSVYRNWGANGFRALAICAVTGFVRAAAQEQPPAEPPVAPALTIQQVEESIRATTENTGLEESLKSTVLEIYNQALEQSALPQVPDVVSAVKEVLK